MFIQGEFMSLFVIADTHLSFGTNKPMDFFDGWQNYEERLCKNWNKIVNCNDDVVIAGDISWAMNFEQLIPDLKFIESLNGNKIILKGNHDYWWNTVSKMNDFLKKNDLKTIKFLHNNSYLVNNISVCGSRGWMFESDEKHDERVLTREAMRLRRSLESAKSDDKIVFLHYPPVTTNSVCTEIIEVLKEYGIKKCYFGHLHGEGAKYAREGNIEDIDFKLISCDRLNFTPYLINKY